MEPNEEIKTSSERTKRGKDLFVRKLQQAGFELKSAVELWEVAYLAGGMDATEKAQGMFEVLRQKIRDLRLPLTPLVLLLVGCADARSSGRPEAERVFTDQPGYACFLVRDEDGRAVGGNCVREE